MKTTITTPNGQTIEVSIPRRRNLQSVVLTVLGALFVWGILFFTVSGNYIEQFENRQTRPLFISN